MSGSPIGLIGVGLLGTALAERMRGAGLDVLGFDLDGSRVARLCELGGRAATDAAHVARGCEQIVLCLPDSKIVSGVVGAMSEDLRAGSVLIDATTGDPEDSESLSRTLATRGVGYVDATIAGSSEQARRGEATILIGSSETDLARAANVLASWSERRFHAGPAGSGARLKLVVNLVLGLNRAVLAEGLALAKACGIDAGAALGVLKATPAYSAVMDTKGPKMVAGDYAPAARLAQHLKDVGLIREMARRCQAFTPLSEVHQGLLQKAAQLGYADADNSAVIEAFRNETV